MRSRVDLPQPERPTSTRNSPSATWSVTCFTAYAPRPNDLPTPAKSTPAMRTPPATTREVDADVGHEQHDRADHEPRQLRLERVDERVRIGEEARGAAENLLAEARQHPAPRKRAEQRAERKRHETHARGTRGQRDEMSDHGQQPGEEDADHRVAPDPLLGEEPLLLGHEQAAPVEIGRAHV